MRSPLSHSVDPLAWELDTGPSCQLALNKFSFSTWKFDIHSFNLNFGIWPHRHTHTQQCSPASVGLAQARPNQHDIVLVKCKASWREPERVVDVTWWVTVHV